MPTGPALLVFAGLAADVRADVPVRRALLPDHVLVGNEQGADAHGAAAMGNATVTVMVEDPPVWETR